MDNMTLLVFSYLEQTYYDESWIARKVVLTTRNEQLHFLNDIIWCRVPRNTQTVLSADSVEGTEINKLSYTVELSNNLPGTASLPYHLLTLEKAYVVRLLSNL